MSFAAAIGSVVGILTLLAFGTFISLFCRRRKAKRRLALLHAEQEEAEIREYGGRLQGPQPFRPRYFPGTLPPFDPEEEEGNIPPPYESSEGEPLVIAPLPPPPPPPPPPPIFAETLQVREVSNSTPVSIAPVSSPPLSLRRSSVISLVAPNYATAVPSSDPDSTESTTSDLPPREEDGSNVNARQGPTSSRPVRPPLNDIREDETSDGEMGGLLSSNPRERSPSAEDVVHGASEEH